MHLICRTCLCEISDDNRVVLSEDKESLRIKTELSVCVPEIVVDIVINPVVCFKCVHALHLAYEFKTQCLQTEERINNYIKNKNSDTNRDLHVQKLKISISQSYIAPTNKKPTNCCSKPTTHDIIDDLNNLLDEALQNTPKRRKMLEDTNKPVKGNDKFDQCVTEPDDISDSDEDKKSIRLQNNTPLKDCSVVCEKVPEKVVNSKPKIMSLTQNVPMSKVKPDKKRRSGHVVLKCSVCAYVTSNRYHFKAHRMIHTGEKPFACNLCNYCSAFKCNLKTHMSTHTGEKQLACTICSYKSALKHNLERHIKIHEKPYL